VYLSSKEPSVDDVYQGRYEASWWAGPGEYILRDGQLRTDYAAIERSLAQEILRPYKAADIAATLQLQTGLLARLYGRKEPQKKGGNVQKADDLLAERQAQRVLEELLAKKEAALAGLGDDEFQNDDVIFFKHQFDEGGTVYSYAALKTGDAWYTTGPRGARYTWDQLKLFMVSGPVPTTSFIKLHRYDEG
jgi:hypothetical protein